MLVTKEKIAEGKRDMLRRVRAAGISQSGPVRAFADQSGRIRGQLEEKLLELDGF